VSDLARCRTSSATAPLRGRRISAVSWRACCCSRCSIPFRHANNRLQPRPNGFRLIKQGLGAWRRTMTVRAILTLKGRECVTIAPDATLTEAAKLLAKHRIGALVITGPERRVVGILSERDIVAR